MKKIKSSLNKNTSFILHAAVICLLLPFLILSIFNHPASDDFCYTNYIRDNQFWAAQVKHYFIWTGRFTATFLLTIDPIDLEDLTVYRILPITLLILFGISIFFFIKSLLPDLARKDQNILSLLILFLYLYYIPNTAEAFYWRAGSLTYQLASTLSLFLFATIRNLQQQQSPLKKIILTILACLLAVFTIGLNETSMIIILVIVSLWTFGWIILRKKKRVEMAIILFVTIAATTTVVVAPGNAVRMAEKSEKFQFLFSLVGAIKIALVDILRWIPMPVLLVALFSPLFNRIGAAVNTRYNLNWMRPWHLFMGGLFLFFFLVITYFPSFWSQGGRPPYRTINVIYLLFILSTFFLASFFFAYLQYKKTPVPQIPSGAQLLLVMITLSIVVAKPNNIREAYLDVIEGTAYYYNREMHERYLLLENCSRDTCTIPALKNKPKTILSSDLSSNPSHESYYYNACIADHFGIQKVFLPEKEKP